MLVDAVEFEICDLIVAAVNAAALDASNFGSLNVTAVLSPSARLALEEQLQEISVFVIPGSDSATLASLDGIEEESIGIHVIVAKKLLEGSDAEIRQMVSLCRSIWSVIESDVPAAMTGLQWLGRNVDPLYDHDAVRDKRQFWCEALTTWSLHRAE